MIIWQRWGFLVLLCAGLGALTGFGLNTLIDPASMADGQGRAIFFGLGLVAGAVYAALLVHLVILPRLDRPRPVPERIDLAQPVPGPHGVQTHQIVQATDPRTGQPLTRRPRSSLFFVPVQYWPYVLGVIGFGLTAYGGLSWLLG